MCIICWFFARHNEEARNGLLCEHTSVSYTSHRFTIIDFRRCKFYCGFMKNTFGSVATNIRKMYYNWQTVLKSRKDVQAERNDSRQFVFSIAKFLTFFKIKFFLHKICITIIKIEYFFKGLENIFKQILQFLFVIIILSYYFTLLTDY